MNNQTFIDNYYIIYTNYKNAERELDQAISKVDDIYEDIGTLTILKNNIKKYGITPQMASYLNTELGFEVSLSKQELIVSVENLFKTAQESLTEFINWLITKIRNFLKWILDWFNVSQKQTTITTTAIKKDDPKKEIGNKEVTDGFYDKNTMIKINGDIVGLLQKLSVNKIRDISLAHANPQSQINTSTKFDELIQITTEITEYAKNGIKQYPLHSTFKSAGIHTVKDLQDPIYKRIMDVNADNDREIINRMKLLETVIKQYEIYVKTKDLTNLPALSGADLDEYVKDPAAYTKVIENRIKMIHKVLAALRSLQACNKIIHTQYNRFRRHYNKTQN